MPPSASAAAAKARSGVAAAKCSAPASATSAAMAAITVSSRRSMALSPVPCRDRVAKRRRLQPAALGPERQVLMRLGGWVILGVSGLRS